MRQTMRSIRVLVLMLLLVSNFVLLFAFIVATIHCSGPRMLNVAGIVEGIQDSKFLSELEPENLKSVNDKKSTVHQIPNTFEGRQSHDHSPNFELRPKLPAEIRSELAEGIKYSRSAKTKWILTNVFKAVSKQLGMEDDVLKYHTLSQSEERNMKSPETPEFCLETWTRSNCSVCGYHHRQKCSKIPINDLVSVVINHRQINSSILSNLIDQITESYPGINVLVSRDNSVWEESSLVDKDETEKRQNGPSNQFVRYFKFNVSANDLRIWSDLIDSASTKYVLLLKDVYYFNKLVDFERLIDAMTSADAKIVGGSFRTRDSRWYANCYQSFMLNYTLKYEEGYHFSQKSCMFCDYLHGPLFANTQFLKDNLQLAKITIGKAMFLEFFLKLQQNATLFRSSDDLNNVEDRDFGVAVICCSDVMFHVESGPFESLPHIESWMLARHLILNRINFPEQNPKIFGYENFKNKNCIKWAVQGVANPIMCSELLRNALVDILTLMENNGVRYEIIAGTMIGAVKFDNVVPWERDADVFINAGDFYKVVSIQKLLEKKYMIEYNSWPPENAEQNSTCNDGFYCGEISIYVPGGWRITFLAIYSLPFTIGPMNHTGPPADWAASLVQIGSKWVYGGHNPGNIRHYYKDEIFVHLEHSATRYIASKNGDEHGNRSHGIIPFLRCPIPGFHGCLANYLESGNLHFKDLI